MIPKQLVEDFNAKLQTQGIRSDPLITDVQQLIHEQMQQVAGRNPPTSLADFDYSVYHPYAEVILLCLFAYKPDHYLPFFHFYLVDETRLRF